MKIAIARTLAVSMAVSFSCARALVSVQVEPELQTSLHIGEIAALRLPSDREYVIVGSAGGSLETVKQQGRRAAPVYRAAQAGNQTLVATPKGLRDGDCVSCVTVHYFVKVIP